MKSMAFKIEWFDEDTLHADVCKVKHCTKYSKLREYAIKRLYKYERLKSVKIFFNVPEEDWDEELVDKDYCYDFIEKVSSDEIRDLVLDIII